jgi:LuxR family maltose regulon positive regulatory protein
LSCAKSYGACLYQIRALLLRARVAQALKDRDKACGLIGQAVELAAAEKIIRPFLEQYELAQCFTQLKRELWETGRHPVEASFLSDVTDILSEFYPDTQQTLLVLSAREQEVMQELSRGLTNKEIARVLDMTEHTVKFHLKNIFAKLNVDRRAHAIEIYRKTEASTL